MKTIKDGNKYLKAKLKTSKEHSCFSLQEKNKRR